MAVRPTLSLAWRPSEKATSDNGTWDEQSRKTRPNAEATYKLMTMNPASHGLRAPHSDSAGLRERELYVETICKLFTVGVATNIALEGRAGRPARCHWGRALGARAPDALAAGVKVEPVALLDGKAANPTILQPQGRLNSPPT